MSDKEEAKINDGTVVAFKALLRWVTLLENSSSSVISDLPRYASAKNVDLKEIEQGKLILQYIANSLKEQK